MKCTRDTDGNGRVARAVMNAALVAAGQARVIITTGYRDDYLRALKAFPSRKAAHPFVLMIDRTQEFVSELPLEEYEEPVTTLEATGALG